MNLWTDGSVWSALISVVARARELGTSQLVPMLSVAESLVRLVSGQLATDIGRLKEALLARTEAKTEQQRASSRLTNAQAIKTLAEAAEIANRSQSGQTTGRERPSLDPARRDLESSAQRLQQYGALLGVDTEELAALLTAGTSVDVVQTPIPMQTVVGSADVGVSETVIPKLEPAGPEGEPRSSPGPKAGHPSEDVGA